MRLLIIEDHISFRDSFRIAIEQQTDFQVVGEGATGREARSLIETLRPDVMILDFMLKDTDGIAVLGEMKRRRLRVNTLMLARIAHPAFVDQAFQAGALGFALKQDPLAEVMNGLSRVSRGQKYLSPRLVAADPDTDSPLNLLSGREREVFCRLLDALGTKEIAAQLCVSERTIHAHRLSINRKLGVRSPGQLTRLAAANGLLPT